jgi:hypothetical protein
MEIIAIILTISYVIWLNRLIRFGVKTAARIAVATEASAKNLEYLAQTLHDREIERLGLGAVEQSLS